MKTFLISYDLMGPETREDYVQLITHIKSFTYWAKPLKSVWLIKTDKGIAEVRNELKQYTDSNDKILVIDVSGANWATSNISTQITEWLKNNI
ncbi:hypothetical protein EPN90_03975 [Patescibacteria group bacterium]|nr:MAG: hypothetical protein EPN90_03975 [Patescibacteria group bacterium]